MSNNMCNVFFIGRNYMNIRGFKGLVDYDFTVLTLCNVAV